MNASDSILQRIDVVLADVADHRHHHASLSGAFSNGRVEFGADYKLGTSDKADAREHDKGKKRHGKDQ